MPQSAGSRRNARPIRSASLARSFAAAGCSGAQASTRASLSSALTSTFSGSRVGRATNATSRRPVRTCSTNSSEPPCRSRISSAGCSLRKPVSSAGRLIACRHWSEPIESEPRSRPWTAATASFAALLADRARSASTRSACPAAVSCTCRVLRRNSVAPNSFSSERIDADRPDWAMCRRCAARVKWHSCATATKCSSCLSSTVLHLHPSATTSRQGDLSLMLVDQYFLLDRLIHTGESGEGRTYDLWRSPVMQTRWIGDRAVSAIGLGGMPMSIEGRPDEQRSVAAIHAALDAGVTLIDTADAYHRDANEVGHNESLIARALASYGGDTSDVLVATKGGHLRPGDGSWTQNGDPAYLKQACEASLKRLGVEAIGLYQFHRPDPQRPVRRLGRRAARTARRGQDRARGPVQRQPRADPAGPRDPRRRPGQRAEPVLAGVPLQRAGALPVQRARARLPAVEPVRRDHPRGRRSATASPCSPRSARRTG